MIERKVAPAASSRRSACLDAGSRIMLFELSIYGHHAVYIQHLVRYWCEQALSGHFYLVVAPQFLEKHADVVAIAQQYPQANVSFLALTAAEFAGLSDNTTTFIRRKARAWQEWRLICAYARQLKVSHCFLDSFDFFQWPFLWGQSPPCAISGIYFKPVFHYPTFAQHVTTSRSFLQQQWEQIRLSAIFRQSHLHRLFCLDPFAVKNLNSRFARGKAVALADPVPTYPLTSQPSGLREQLNVDPGRRAFLLFGDITDRKGVVQLLSAIALLPEALSRQLCLLIVGRCSEQMQQSFRPQLEQLQQAQAAQIIEHYEFISEQAVREYFQLADVILAPYQRHVGMSGILLQAAAARRPVLSSNYGLMGELVRYYQLGLAVDSTRPGEIAKALSQLLQAPLAQVYNAAKMQQFVGQNTVEKFASTIFGELLEVSEVQQ